MKVFYNLVKIVAIITWLFTITQMIFLTIVKYKYAIDTKGASAIGIIGAADGPTSIYVATINSDVLPICPYIAVIATVILLVKKIRHNRTK